MSKYLYVAVLGLACGCGSAPEDVVHKEQALVAAAEQVPIAEPVGDIDLTSLPVAERDRTPAPDGRYPYSPFGWRWNYAGSSYYPGGAGYYYSGVGPYRYNYFMVAAPAYCAPRFGSTYFYNGYNSYIPSAPYYSGYSGNNWYGVYRPSYFGNTGGYFGNTGSYYSGFGFYPSSSYNVACPLTYYYY